MHEQATFLFHGELSHFLAPDRRGDSFWYMVERRASIKDIIEALGVPHTEVGTIEVAGRTVDFSHILAPGTAVEVWPNPPGHFSTLRPPLPWPPVFLLDTHLGTLARYLRLLGFDSRYANDSDDPELAESADRDDLVLLTRDRGLLKRSRVTFARFICDDQPRAQLADIFEHFQLRSAMRPFTRCTRCNGVLQDVPKAEIAHRLAPKTKRYYDAFRECPDCGRLFWHGSHLGPMQHLIDELPS